MSIPTCDDGNFVTKHAIWEVSAHMRADLLKTGCHGCCMELLEGQKNAAIGAELRLKKSFCRRQMPVSVAAGS